MGAGNVNAARNIVPLRRQRPPRFDNRERIMEMLSQHVMTSPWSYRTIAHECGLAVSTVQKIGRRETLWPRPRTLFTLANYFGLELALIEKGKRE